MISNISIYERYEEGDFPAITLHGFGGMAFSLLRRLILGQTDY